MLNYSTPSIKKPRIAIAGATGRVSAVLMSLLGADPIELVALTRRPSAMGVPQGVRAFKVDFQRADTLEEALRGVDRPFIAHGTSLEQATNEIALIDAAVASRVRHIVKLSALGPFTCRAARCSARRRTISAGSRCPGWTGPNVPRVCDSRNDFNRRGTYRKSPTFVDRVVDRQPGRVPGVTKFVPTPGTMRSGARSKPEVSNA